MTADNRLNDILTADAADDRASKGTAKADPPISLGRCIESMESAGLHDLAKGVRKFVTAVERLASLFERPSTEGDAVSGPQPSAPSVIDDLEILNRFLKPPIAKPYQTLLRSKDFNLFDAWILPQMIMHHAPQMAEETNLARRSIKPLLRKLGAVTKNMTLVRSRAARGLLAALENPEAARLVESGLKRMPVPILIRDFFTVLERAAERRADACEEVGTLARCLASHVPDSRGRPVSEARSAHRALLHCLKKNGHNSRYTMSDGEFTDPVAVATRDVFKLKNFDPRGALSDWRS